MPTDIKNLQNNRKVVFDSGKFDNWCVYVVEPNGTKRAPFDVDYFTDFQALAASYTPKKVYDDFLQIYHATTSTLSLSVCSLIDSITQTYNPADQPTVEKWLAVIYGGMVAEENKQYTKLKKRIKRLGMHQLLIDNMTPLAAANFSKGKKWPELDTLMKSKGF